MTRALLSLLLSVALTGLVAPLAAWAGSPHFVEVSITRTSATTLTVEGKEAGLGNEGQVDIEVTATAACINPGQKHPKAANKESLSAVGQFPVQNGKAEFSLTLEATFQPDCTPPMTVVFSDVTVCDITNGICAPPGTF